MTPVCCHATRRARAPLALANPVLGPLLATLLLATLLVATACGGGGDTGPVTPPAASVATVAVSAATPLVPTQTATLVATLADANGNALSGRTVTWASSSSAVASVSSSGVVTAVAAGTAVITATSEGRAGTSTVTVLAGGVVTAAGGSVAGGDGRVRLDFPAAALTSSTPISIVPVTDAPAAILAGTAYDFGPSGATFSKPATIRMQYDPAALPAGTDPTSLRVVRKTPTNWVVIDSNRVDVATRTVSAVTSHFSQYALCTLPCPPLVARITLDLDSVDYTVRPGGSATLKGELDGFHYGGSQVTLRYGGLPTGLVITSTFDGQLGFDSFVSKLFTFTATASATVTPGVYPVHIVATGVNVEPDSAFLRLRVRAPGIGLSAEPASGVVTAGSSTSVALTLARDGVSSPVSVNVVGLPSGVTASVSPSPIVGNSATLTLTASASATAGTTNGVVLRATATGAPTQDLPFPISVLAGASFSIAATPPTVALTPNGSASTGVRATRTGGFNGAISYAITGLPSGVTAAITPTAVADSMRLTLTANALALSGTSTATVTATSGSIVRTTTLSVGIGAPGTSVVRLDVSDCAALGAAVQWVALQPANGVFTVLAAANGVYTTQIAATRAVAAIAWQQDGRTTVTVVHGTPDELSQFRVCTDAAAGSKHVRVATPALTATQRAFVGLSGAQTEILPNETVTLTSVRDGPRTIVAMRYDTVTQQYQRGLLRRHQNPVADGLVTLDFAAPDAFAPVVAPLAVTAAGLDANWGVSMRYLTDGDCADPFAAGWRLFPGTGTLVGLPASVQSAQDVHELALSSSVGQGPVLTQFRTTRRFFRTVSSQALSIGSAMPTPAVTTLAGPYRRLQAVFALPADYTLGRFVYGTASQNIELIGTVGYFGGHAMTLSMPDLSGVAGFNTAWAPGASSSGTTVLSGESARSCTDGAEWRYAGRMGSF